MQFLKSYAEEFGIPHPAPLHGRVSMPPVYLPASKTIQAIHADYVFSCCAEGPDVCCVRITAFRSVWKACLPHLKIMSVRSDVCSSCEKHREKIAHAVTEEEKKDSLAAFTAHLQLAQAE